MLGKGAAHLRTLKGGGSFKDGGGFLFKGGGSQKWPAQLCFGPEINFQKDSAVITDLRQNFDPIDFGGVVGQKEVQGIFASSGFK